MSTWEECRKIHELFPSSPDPDLDPVAFLISIRHSIAELKEKIQALDQEAKEGDGWQARAKQYFENGGCPICFCTDEGGHKPGCEWGEAPKEIKDLKDRILGLQRSNESLKTLADEDSWREKYFVSRDILGERDQKIAWLREQVHNLLPAAPGAKPMQPYKYQVSGKRRRASYSAPNPGALDHLVQQLVNHKLALKHLVNQIEEAKKILEAP